MGVKYFLGEHGDAKCAFNMKERKIELNVAVL